MLDIRLAELLSEKWMSSGMSSGRLAQIRLMGTKFIATALAQAPWPALAARCAKLSMGCITRCGWSGRRCGCNKRKEAMQRAIDPHSDPHSDGWQKQYRKWIVGLLCCCQTNLVTSVDSWLVHPLSPKPQSWMPMRVTHLRYFGERNAPSVESTWASTLYLREWGCEPFQCTVL